VNRSGEDLCCPSSLQADALNQQKKFSIEIRDEKLCYTRSTNEARRIVLTENGDTKFRRRIFEKLGWRLFVIDAADWNSEDADKEMLLACVPT